MGQLHSLPHPAHYALFFSWPSAGWSQDVEQNLKTNLRHQQETQCVNSGEPPGSIFHKCSFSMQVVLFPQKQRATQLCTIVFWLLSETLSSLPPVTEASCEPIKIEMCQELSYNSTSFPNIWLMIPHQQSAEELLQDYMVRPRADPGWQEARERGKGVHPWGETRDLHRVVVAWRANSKLSSLSTHGQFKLG